ncbi:MAG: catalase [Polaromonas sp.]|nr:catalase [Polaromonas sp.]
MPKTNPPADVRKNATKSLAGAKAAARNTDRGPALASADSGGDVQVEKVRQTQALVAAMPFNTGKSAEHGFANATAPQPGATAKPASRLPTSSTLSERHSNEKTGSVAAEGVNATIEPLDRVRVDSSGQMLTTNQGVAVADNQNSLKFGLRGPALLEDFVLREKITHFDHERIPERIVHARGSGECADCAGTQQSARWPAPPGDQPGTGELRAQFTGRRLPFPGGRGAGIRHRAGPAASAGRTGQGARQAGKICRPLHPGYAVLQQPDTGGKSAYCSGLPV